LYGLVCVPSACCDFEADTTYKLPAVSCAMVANSAAPQSSLSPGFPLVSGHTSLLTCTVFHAALGWPAVVPSVPMLTVTLLPSALVCAM